MYTHGCILMSFEIGVYDVLHTVEGVLIDVFAAVLWYTSFHAENVMPWRCGAAIRIAMELFVQKQEEHRSNATCRYCYAAWRWCWWYTIYSSMILPMCGRHNLESVIMLWIVRLVCTSKIVATLCLGLVALLGDHIVARSTLSENVRAFVDNMTHGAIGLLSWHIVTANLGDLTLSMRVCEVVFCGLIASAVDLDHFATARSLRIQDALQLSSRPLMHCTSIILAVFGLMLLLAHVFQWPSLHHFSWILVAAVVSHHLRDATRRGLWLYPFGSSPPIPYTGYMLGCMLLPHVIPSLMQRTQLAHHPATRPSVISV